MRISDEIDRAYVLPLVNRLRTLHRKLRPGRGHEQQEEKYTRQSHSRQLRFDKWFLVGLLSQLSPSRCVMRPKAQKLSIVKLYSRLAQERRCGRVLQDGLPIS